MLFIINMLSINTFSALEIDFYWDKLTFAVKIGDLLVR